MKAGNLSNGIHMFLVSTVILRVRDQSPEMAPLRQWKVIFGMNLYQPNSILP